MRRSTHIPGPQDSPAAQGRAVPVLAWIAGVAGYVAVLLLIVFFGLGGHL